MPPRRTSPHAAAGRQVQDLAALADDPAAQRVLALALLDRSTHLEVLRAALAVLGEARDPDLRPALHAKYDWCEAAPGKRDGSGYIRAGIVRALQPVINPDDAPLLQRAMVTYQMVGIYEVCAELRAAALLAANDLDPALAALFAARFLHDPRNSFSGEPARTALDVLAAQQNLGPVFAIASWAHPSSEVTADALRRLVDLPASLVPLLVETHRASVDEQVLLGLFDLLLGHPTRDAWVEEFSRFFRTTQLLDLYGVVAMQVVGSRSDALIRLLRNLAEVERDPARKALLDHALELA
jgi:hypothetical protein